VITIRPTRSADGAVGVTVDTASVLGMELCLPGSGDGVTSRDVMSALQEAGGNARWLLSQCPRCITGMARIGPAGHLTSTRLGVSQRRACLGGERDAALPAFHPGGQFRLASQR
jgi:hypothetical protein